MVNIISIVNKQDAFEMVDTHYKVGETIKKL